MKFIALLSGGKDSCYNIVKCVQHGHELVCLANLYPPAEFNGHDLDSFMYQTVGHNIVDAYSECFAVPMIRRSIQGMPVSKHLNYDAVEEDEVEDLYRLLKEIVVSFWILFMRHNTF